MASPSINPLRLRSTEQSLLDLSPRMLEVRKSLLGCDWLQAKAAIAHLTDSFEKDLAISELATSYLAAGRVFDFAIRAAGQIENVLKQSKRYAGISSYYLELEQDSNANAMVEFILDPSVQDSQHLLIADYYERKGLFIKCIESLCKVLSPGLRECGFIRSAKAILFYGTNQELYHFAEKVSAVGKARLAYKIFDALFQSPLVDTATVMWARIFHDTPNQKSYFLLKRIRNCFLKGRQSMASRLNSFIANPELQRLSFEFFIGPQSKLVTRSSSYAEKMRELDSYVQKILVKEKINKSR